MILVIDIGTSSLRAVAVADDGTIHDLERRVTAPVSPAPGLVEFDPMALADTAIEAAQAVLDRVGAVDAVGIASQRASTVVWDRSSGLPIGPGLGWQDLRTVGECLAARAEHGYELAPNQTATKAAWLLHQAGTTATDPCIGTVDAWIMWALSQGAVHLTDHTNAAVTGLYHLGEGTWDPERCETLGIDVAWLPTIVDSVGDEVVGTPTGGPVAIASALRGAPPIAAVIGDQQASLVGQGCVVEGAAKITFGTGAMLDVCTGARATPSGSRSPQGTFSIVAWAHQAERVWGTEAIMLSAGTAVEWLVDDLGLIDSAAQSHDVAARCRDADGVMFVPALLGLGTPQWDYGARGTLVGLTRGTTSAHVVRAVLEGVAHRGADLIEAARADTGLDIGVIRIDGGMSQNPTFVQALADAAQIVVETSPIVEATTLGAAHLAGVATRRWSSVPDTAALWNPAARVEPSDDPVRRTERARWRDAIARSAEWIPELSSLDF